MTGPPPGAAPEGVPASTRADMDEQLSGDFEPLTCRQCDTVVLVRKRSPQQTSVQWQSEAMYRCPFLARASPNAPPVEGCRS